jgi:hypothetical protein
VAQHFLDVDALTQLAQQKEVDLGRDPQFVELNGHGFLCRFMSLDYQVCLDIQHPHFAGFHGFSSL